MTHVKLTLAFLVAGCSSSSHGVLVDARSDSVADSAPSIPVTCTCCTKIVTAATDLTGIASDGATIYVRSTAGSISTVAADGTLATIVPTSSAMTTIPDGVAYTVATPTAVEVHERVGTTDRVLGSVTGTANSIAGNATDIYVFGATTTATLWRFSRAASNAAPVVVATGMTSSGVFALGTSSAAWVDSGGVEMTAIPGPSTPTSISFAVPGLAYAGDTLFSWSAAVETSHSDHFTLKSIAPSGVTLFDTGLEDGFVRLLAGSPDHLFWSSYSQGQTEALLMSTPSGTTTKVCGSWVSEVLAVTPTTLYGLEGSNPDSLGTVDVLAR